jgi:hypothetical protein
MIKNWGKTLMIPFILTSCIPFERPRVINWKKEWKESGTSLKDLTQQIKENKEGIYQIGNNNFPSSFDYPFNDGFYIGYGSQNMLIDTNKISIRFYIDRGLLDHFSAFIYTKDSAEIKQLESKVQQGGNDYKIENNWYVVND